MTVEEMVCGLVRAAESKEQADGGSIWDDECRNALAAARARGWGKNAIGHLDEVDTDEHEQIVRVDDTAVAVVEPFARRGSDGIDRCIIFLLDPHGRVKRRQDPVGSGHYLVLSRAELPGALMVIQGISGLATREAIAKALM